MNIRKMALLELGLILALAACATDQPSSPAAPETIPAEYAGLTNPLGAEAATSGGEVYRTYCASCHGDTGHGDGVAGSALVPPPRNLVELGPQVADDYLYWRIHDGKSGTAMVAWKGILGEDQIWQVIAFLRTLE